MSRTKGAAIKPDSEVSRECLRQRRCMVAGICVTAACGGIAVNKRHCEPCRCAKAAYMKTRKRTAAGIPMHWPDQRGRWARPKFGALA